MNGTNVTQPASDFRPNLIDLAPTILHILGLSVPGDMDGRVLEEILTVDRPIRYEDIDNTVVRLAQTYSQGDADIVAQRLRGLGYLD